MNPVVHFTCGTCGPLRITDTEEDYSETPGPVALERQLFKSQAAHEIEHHLDLLAVAS